MYVWRKGGINQNYSERNRIDFEENMLHNPVFSDTLLRHDEQLARDIR